jgi:SAM-dependent methyltransferase
MIDSLRRFVQAQQYDPSWAGPFLNPFHLARLSLRRAIAAHADLIAGPILDVGCGSKPYRDLFATDTYVGLDIDTPGTRAQGLADVFYAGERFPFEDKHFRGVLCNQVLEHVFRPEAFLSEIHRVLDSGGRMLLTVPFVWDEHEQPLDFARYSSFGLAALLQRNGFRVVEHRKLMADSSVLFQLANAYLYKVTRSRSRIINLMVTAVLMAPVSILGQALGKLLPANPDLFLDQLVIAEKL